MTAKRPTVTVIIPTFNCGPWIGEAIDSVLRQTTPVYEIIVIDDGSTDDTSRIVSRYGKRVRYLIQANSGVAAARNSGISIAMGDWIAFLDADDVWHPRKLEFQMDVIASNPQLGLLGTGLLPWPEAPMRDVSPSLNQLRVVDRAALAVKNHLATSSVLVNRQIVNHVGSFDVALCGPEDHDYWLRVADIAEIAILSLPLTGYRELPGSLSKRAISMEAGMKRILSKLDERDFWRGDRLLRRRANAFVDYSSAYMFGAAGNQPAAIRRLLSSILWYPMRQRSEEVGTASSRTKRLAVATLRLLRLKPADDRPACRASTPQGTFSGSHEVERRAA